jgi:SAM-dependent MidA family methyltransferase
MATFSRPPFGPDTSGPDIPASPDLEERLRSVSETLGGALSFARFMEMALYEPGLGYYERAPGVVGRGGDFATSVSVGSLFGELVAFWIGHAFGADDPAASGPIEIVEVGAHDGRWAADILTALTESWGDGADRFRYRIIEPSPVRRRWQQERLARFGDRVRWSDALPAQVRGVILSNELLDAFPVERWRWSAEQRRWVEQGVRWRAGRWEWVPMATPSPSDWELPEALQAVLPDGFCRERSPAAVAWWGRAAEVLQQGCLLTFDYGLDSAEEFLAPNRAHGTLRAYHRHRLSEDPLQRPGEVDLTSHVDFSAVAEAGERQGLSTWHRERQSRFLMRILESTRRPAARFPEWTPARVRAFQTLTHPEHFGRSFRVLAQGRGPGPVDPGS